MLTKKHLLTLFAALSSAQMPLCAMEAAKSITLLLPVNHLLENGKRLSLQVEVPENFGPLKELSNPVVEFIPRNQNRNNWTQMVTTQVIINQRRNAQAVTSYLKNGINQIATEVHLVEESSTNRSEYTESQLVIAYTLNKRRELLFARYFSGPADCAGFQYCMLVNLENPATGAIKKIKEFAANKTQLFTF